MMKRFVLALALLFAAALPASAQFASQAQWGGTGAGSANAQTVTIYNVTSKADILGVPISFLPSLNNTGPAQLNIAGTGLTAINRITPEGLAALSGNELVAGVIATVVWDGTVYELVSYPVIEIGSTIELRTIGSTTYTPNGYLLEDGSCVSQTTYAPLFAKISTSYGSCGGGLFALPNSKGSVFAAIDNQGAGGNANRITNAGSGCTGTTIGQFCGGQNVTIAQAGLPAVSLTVSVTSTVSDILRNPGGLAAAVSSGGGIGTSPCINGCAVTSTGVTSNLGSGAPTPVLNPVVLGLRAIKY